MVSPPNAVVHPSAMMVEVLYAFVANVAVLASWRHYGLAVRAEALRLQP